MGRASRFSPEVRERAVRLVLTQQEAHESQWAAIQSIAGKIGCTAETLRTWVRQSERDAGTRPGLTTDERTRAAPHHAAVSPPASVATAAGVGITAVAFVGLPGTGSNATRPIPSAAKSCTRSARQ